MRWDTPPYRCVRPDALKRTHPLIDVFGAPDRHPRVRPQAVRHRPVDRHRSVVRKHRAAHRRISRPGTLDQSVLHLLGGVEDEAVRSASIVRTNTSIAVCVCLFVITKTDGRRDRTDGEIGRSDRTDGRRDRTNETREVNGRAGRKAEQFRLRFRDGEIHRSSDRPARRLPPPFRGAKQIDRGVCVCSCPRAVRRNLSL